MSYDFNAEEIYEMAQQIERNGAAFYRKAAASVDDASGKELLLNFAEMEVAHERMFAELKKDLSEKDKSTTTFDPEGEAALYLRALADTRVFFEKRIDTTSLKEILKAAIMAEKDSIVFYLGMKEMVPDDLGKAK
ncbi:MAG: ferritin family protein, partial [Desulfobacterales bacterium]|nr:ferritin family protein [Desulfobacterales bacterium]